MATAGGIKAGKAFIEFFVADKTAAGIDMVGKKVSAAGRSIARMGASIMAGASTVLGPMGMATKLFANAGDELDKMAGRTGASVEFLSALGYAAKRGGSSLKAMEKDLIKLQDTAAKADRGLSDQKYAFEELGVDVRGQDGMLKGPEQLFRETTRALDGIQEHGKRIELARILFGRDGAGLLPMIEAGKDAISDLMDRAKELGIVWTAEEAKSAADLTDAWTDTKEMAKMLAVSIGGALAPALRAATQKTVPFLKTAIAWIKQNKELIVTTAKIAVVVFAAGAAITALGLVLMGLGGILGFVASAASAASAAIAVMGTVAGVVFSPIGAIVAALTLAVVGLIAQFALLAAAILHYSGIGKAAFGWMKETFGEAWSAIVSRVKSGDLQGAMEIAVAGLKLLWAEFKNWIIGLWLDMKQKWLELVYDMQKAVGIDGTETIKKLVDVEVDRITNNYDLFQAKLGLKQSLQPKEETPDGTSMSDGFVPPPKPRAFMQTPKLLQGLERGSAEAAKAAAENKRQEEALDRIQEETEETNDHLANIETMLGGFQFAQA